MDKSNRCNPVLYQNRGDTGGTYAHTDIAFEFASWIFPEFKLYIIKDYQWLKRDEVNRLAIVWDAKRELSKINYRIHTDAVKEFLITRTLSSTGNGLCICIRSRYS